MRNVIPALLLILAGPTFGQSPAVTPTLQTAAAALQRGDFAQAEERLRAELKLRPTDAEAMSLLGVALDNLKRLVEADDAHRQALTMAPQSARVMGRYGNHLAFAGDETGAREAFQRVLRMDPADHTANVQLATLALRTHDPAHGKEALEYIGHLPATQQDAADAAVLRLIAIELTGDSKEAEAVFSRLSRATEKDAEASASIGWTLAQASRFERAETFLTHSLAADPSNFHVLYDLGVVALYAKHYERARGVLESAVRQQPRNVDALYSLSFTYSALHQPEPALRLLAQAAKLDPKRADVQRLIAVTAAELLAYEDSAAAWERYAELAPNDDTARRERGFARIHLRQFETGMADLEWYVAKHPEDPVGHYELGLAQSTNDPTRGMESLDKALQLKPDFAAARSARGALHYLQGKSEAAATDLEKAAAGDPNDSLVLDRLGQAYRAMDRLDDSVRVLRRAAKLAPNEPAIQLHLASALGEAGDTAESEVLMGRYRQMRPPQAPRDLMHYLSLTPEQQQADYRARVEKAVRDNSGDLAAQVRYLKLSLENGQYAQAAQTARIIRDGKADAAILADAGKALLEAGRFGPARELLDKALAGDPFSGLELDVAVAAFRASGPKEGLQALERVPRKGRDTADYNLARAEMLDAAGQAAEAIAAMDRALRAAPGRTGLYWQQMVLLSRNGRTPDAIQLLDRAAEAMPREPKIPLLKATLLENAGNTSQAEKLLDTVLHRWPEGSAGWVARGLILAERAQYGEARKALETAVGLGARSPDAFYYLAECILRTAPERLADAQGAVNRALALAPDDAWVRLLAGNIAFRKKDFRNAVDWQQKAAALRPDWTEPHKALAATYLALGNARDAQAETVLAQRPVKDAAAEKRNPAQLFERRPPEEW